MRFFRRLRHLLQRRQTEAEMAEEMRFHLDQRAADLAADGLPQSEAHYAAQRKFGNLGSLQERAREARGWGWLERLAKDLRFAVRHLAKSPGFTLLAIVTLGLGIGANTSMFSILNGLLLKPLPYADPGTLERFYRVTPQNRAGHLSAADVIDFQRAQAGYGEVAAYGLGEASVAEPGAPAEFAEAGRVTPNLFSLLGTKLQLGRDFRPGEDTPGRDRVVILSQRMWRNRYGGQPDIIGRTIRVDGKAHEVIGVLPASFNDWRYLGFVDLFRPLALSGEQAADRHTTYLRIVGRRAPGLSREQAAAFVASFSQRLAADHPDANADSTWRTESLPKVAAGSGGVTVVPMLIGLSGFVLLIACSNLANLLLARTMARAREFAVRAALGASRTQLLRPLVAESLVLALAGGGLALLVALWFRDWAAVRSVGDNGEAVIFDLDWRVAAWAFGAAIVTAVAFGLAPALFALRLDLNGTLKSGGRGATGGRVHQQFGRVLIIGQFALAMILLAGAGLFIRGLYDLNHRRSGWKSDRLVSGTILMPAAKYSDAEKINAFHRLASERLAALPGVEAVSLSAFTPFFEWPDVRKFVVEGTDRPPAGREPVAVVNRVSAQYFDTFGTRVLAGRAFHARDTATTPKVFILGQSTARTLFGHENPIGRRLAQATSGELAWGEVVGVVNDVRSVAAETDGPFLQIYQPLAQEPPLLNELVVRTGGAVSSGLVDRIRATMAELDPDLPVRQLQAAETTIYRSNYQLAVLRDVLGAIAALGLGLATLGIYGIISRTMAQRRGEFAIRLALGACVRDLTRLVLASGVKLALLGSTIGLLGAFGMSRMLGSAFPGMEISDPAILIATALFLVAVALLACWLPARRAGKVDAMAVLRAE